MAFGAESTTDDVLKGVDLAGKRILVTGASAGLGVETLRALKAHGAVVIGVARDLGKARKALGDAGVGEIELVEADLANLASVRAAADRVRAEGKPLDVIIGNAGIMACPQGKTADGFETQFGTNHLGHFVFFNRIAPLLRSGGRVVMLSSTGHRISDVSIDDPDFEKTPYNAWTSYGRAKTANILYAVALDHRLKGKGIRATAVHPGGIQTELGRHLTADTLAQLMSFRRPGDEIKFKSVPQGAATSVWAAVVAPADAVGGRYCEDCHVAEINDNDSPRAGVRSYALDSAHAEVLWKKSEAMVGETFAL